MFRMTNKKINTRIISVLFAIALWLYVAGGEDPLDYKNIKDIPVQVSNVDTVTLSGLAIKDPQQYKVDVTLQGKRSILGEIKPGEIVAHADLRGHAQKGVNNVPVEVRGLPTNVELADFNPKIIKVAMEQIASTQVPVTLSTGGAPMQGYTVLKPAITPGEVLVNGPESLLSDIKVKTAVMKLDNATKDLKEVLAVKAVDAEGNDIAGLMLNPNIVEVTVPVRKTKQVDIEPAIEGRPSGDWLITDIYLDKDTLMIYGDESALQRISSIKTEPLSLTGVERNTNFNVGLVMPEGVASVDNIDSVTVYISGEKVIKRDIVADRVNFVGLGEGLRFSDDGTIPTVTVTVRGKESAINELAAGGFFAGATLEGLKAGRHTLELKLDLPEGVELISIMPSRIEVILVASKEGED